MNRAVVDASTVLAFLLQESGWLKARQWVGASLISAVNAAEVTSRLMAQGATGALVRSSFDDLHLGIVPFDADLAYLTGELHRGTRDKGLSLADCACLALARARQLPAVSADRAWAGLDLGLEIILVR